MHPFSLLIKPASGDCNLRCAYCFYLGKGALFGKGAHRMSTATLEAVTRAFFACPMDTYTFAWQGGEPALMGLAFYREAVRLQKKLLPAGARCANAFQTNGTLLDDEWARFFKDENFLVGVSIDGPQRLHDARRRDIAGAGSHARVMRGLECLQRHGVEHNALTLVSASNADHPQEVYQYIRGLGVAYHQYIECVELNAEGRPRPYALRPGQWGDFLCAVFDAWFARDTRAVSVRHFDSVLSRLATGVPATCPMSGNCCNYFVVETNGDVFPCDFFVEPRHVLGNIARDPLGALAASDAYQNFGRGKDPCSATCSACRFLPLCMGDCPKNRASAGSFLCADWQRFYGHTIGRFEQLAASLANQAGVNF
ncbi:MAG: anaerobic sulfatase maturase [Kiritimatiellaeota bacterium]|nr:anaerobic sulfatase maturase [Kiritimatiellota bacterium]